MSTIRVSNVETTTIKQTDGTAKISTSLVSPTGYYIRQVNTQTDSTNRTSSTTWTAGPEFTTITGFQPNSLLRINYHVPMRNDSASWGGGYVEPQIRFDGGTYQSLGASGFSTVMDSSAGGTIGFYNNTLLINPAKTSAFTVQMRLYFKSYDGTVQINGGNDVNTTSGTATIMSGVNGLQHWTHITIEELARLV